MAVEKLTESDRRGVFALVFTLAWSVYETGGDYWEVFPRLMAPMAIACLVLFRAATRPPFLLSF